MIVLTDVSKRFGEVAAVDRVSFQLATGASLAMVGPSGSGKTTLLRLIAGLERPDAGEIAINGVSVSRPACMVAPHRRGIGFVFQTSALWPHMNVAGNILFGLAGMPREQANQRLQQVLERASLSRLARRYPDQISGGEARRVAIARSLAPRPEILLMDEPLSHLDVELKTEMLAFIRETVAELQASLIYVTHDPAEAESVSSRVLMLEQGRLKGEVAAIDPSSPFS